MSTAHATPSAQGQDITHDEVIDFVYAPPARITLSRRKGWRLPPNTVKVCRPGKWGNNWIIGKAIHPIIGPIISNDDAVTAYLLDVFEWPHSKVDQCTTELRGKNLACWCKAGTPCHADVLLSVANAGAVAPPPQMPDSTNDAPGGP